VGLRDGARLERVSPEWRYIHTHFGVGYRFAAEPVQGTTAAAAVELEQEFEAMLASDEGEPAAPAAEPARLS
jgi:hypothetical protein